MEEMLLRTTGKADDDRNIQCNVLLDYETSFLVDKYRKNKVKRDKNRKEKYAEAHKNKRDEYLAENSFAVKYPELVEEWDYDKNCGISPYGVTPGSGKRIWWKCRLAMGIMMFRIRGTSKKADTPYVLDRPW